MSVHPSHGFVPAYADPRFQQTLPQGAWTLLTPSNKLAALLYRNEATGEEVLVPSIWYNQPVSWRIENFRYCASGARERAAYWRRSKETWAPTMAAEMDAQAARLDGLCVEMETTGQFPVEAPRG